MGTTCSSSTLTQQKIQQKAKQQQMRKFLQQFPTQNTDFLVELANLKIRDFPNVSHQLKGKPSRSFPVSKPAELGQIATNPPSPLLELGLADAVQSELATTVHLLIHTIANWKRGKGGCFEFAVGWSVHGTLAFRLQRGTTEQEGTNAHQLRY